MTIETLAFLQGRVHLTLNQNKMGQVAQAIDYYERALAVARLMKHRRDEGDNLYNLGDAHQALGQLDVAIPYYQQAINIDSSEKRSRN